MADDKIRITADDLAQVAVRDEQSGAVRPSDGAAGKQWGNVFNEPTPVSVEGEEEKGSFLLQGWFYLGAAGLIGATLGWGICEPSFEDGAGSTWGSVVMMPLVLTLMCLGFGIAESLVERSVTRALQRGGLALLLGLVFGFTISGVANVVFNIGLAIIYNMGVQSNDSPLFWITRGLAWMVFGASAGVVYGLVGRSFKKGLYGVIGGMIGAGLGGVLFDPIANMVDAGELSRGVGFGLFGLATGIAMGLVESALKDRWLYVSSGPLAGKQFILYKPMTTVGSLQQCDIYLFKDPSIQPQHAVIETRGAQTQLRTTGTAPVYVLGQPVRSRVLQSGDYIQIGRYSFKYQEKQRSR